MEDLKKTKEFKERFNKYLNLEIERRNLTGKAREDFIKKARSLPNSLKHQFILGNLSSRASDLRNQSDEAIRKAKKLGRDQYWFNDRIDMELYEKFQNDPNSLTSEELKKAQEIDKKRTIQLKEIRENHNEREILYRRDLDEERSIKFQEEFREVIKRKNQRIINNPLAGPNALDEASGVTQQPPATVADKDSLPPTGTEPPIGTEPPTGTAPNNETSKNTFMPNKEMSLQERVRAELNNNTAELKQKSSRNNMLRQSMVGRVEAAGKERYFKKMMREIGRGGRGSYRAQQKASFLVDMYKKLDGQVATDPAGASATIRRPLRYQNSSAIDTHATMDLRSGLSDKYKGNL